ncbi:hypothetical protein HF324_09240 [Chitinophaga oryzae]|uniref:Uncharacterized protein n=1 Tax=Chitinophaga oryzae TaxID=2725414 RepID=A0ABX6LD78_9BACT|nr:hypothetical protein [Chitinophaga oryzae]QJB38026.1 hypothetical protein HF324_09240 [Chitinophaga oryzae]
MMRKVFALLLIGCLWLASIAQAQVKRYSWQQQDTAWQLVVTNKQSLQEKNKTITFSLVKTVGTRVLQKVTGVGKLNAEGDTESFTDEDNIAIDALEYIYETAGSYISVKLPYDKVGLAFVELHDKRKDTAVRLLMKQAVHK